MFTPRTIKDRYSKNSTNSQEFAKLYLHINYKWSGIFLSLGFLYVMILCSSGVRVGHGCATAQGTGYKGAPHPLARALDIKGRCAPCPISLLPH